MVVPTQFKTGWLVCQSQVLSSLNIADTAKTRRQGLIGQSEIETPLFIDSCRWIHTFGVKCTLDVAYLDEQLQVIKVPAPASSTCFALSTGKPTRRGLIFCTLITCSCSSRYATSSAHLTPNVCIHRHESINSGVSIQNWLVGVSIASAVEFEYCRQCKDPTARPDWPV